MIIALHHEQDIRKMGGLARLLPITYLTFVIGSLALAAMPPFAGFYSKDVIIEAVHASTLFGAHYAYYCVLAGAFVTGVYSFRVLFLTFHTKDRTDPSMRGHIKESPWVILVPLILLAVPSVIAGQMLIEPMLFSKTTLLSHSVFVLPSHNVMQTLAAHFKGANLMALEAGKTLTFWLALSGILVAWVFTSMAPQLATFFKNKFAWLYSILINKYGFDEFNDSVFVEGTKETGNFFYQVSDVKLIDGVMVNGSGRAITWLSKTARRLQTGFLYHYALVMVLGLVLFLAWYIGGF